MDIERQKRARRREIRVSVERIKKSIQALKNVKKKWETDRTKRKLVRCCMCDERQSAFVSGDDTERRVRESCSECGYPLQTVTVYSNVDKKSQIIESIMKDVSGTEVDVEDIIEHNDLIEKQVEECPEYDRADELWEDFIENAEMWEKYRISDDIAVERESKKASEKPPRRHFYLKK